MADPASTPRYSLRSRGRNEKVVEPTAPASQAARRTKGSTASSERDKRARAAVPSSNAANIPKAIPPPAGPARKRPSSGSTSALGPRAKSRRILSKTTRSTQGDTEPTPPVPPTRPCSPELQARAEAFVGRCNNVHLLKYRPDGKAPNAERHAGWKAAVKHVRELARQASSGLIASQDELQQFLEQTNWDGIRLAAWIGRKERGQWASGDPPPLPHIRLRTAHGEAWAAYERLQQADVWRRFGDWEYKAWKTKAAIEPDEWLVAACLVAVLIRTDELKNKLGRDPLGDRTAPSAGPPYRLDVAEGRREAVEMLGALARDGALAKGDDELKAWLADWIESHHYVYRLMYGATPCEVRQAEEADKKRCAEAEEEAARCFAEYDRQRREVAAMLPSSPVDPSIPPSLDAEWDLRFRADDFSNRVLQRFEAKYAPWGTNPNPARHCAWVAFESHIWDRYFALLDKRDDARREELKQCLNMVSSGWDGVRLAAWAQRQSRGEWDPNDPSPVARLRTRTLRRIEKTAGPDAERADVSRFWDVFALVQNAASRDDDCDYPICDDEYDGWARFAAWCKQTKKAADPDMFFVPLAYLASWLCPELMQRRFELSSRFRHRCTVEQMRAESMKFLDAFAAEETVSGKSNSDLAEWILGWAEQAGCAVATRFIFGRTPLEIRNECEKEEETMRASLKYLKASLASEGRKKGEAKGGSVEATSSDTIWEFCDGLTDCELLLVTGEAGTRMWKRHRFTQADLE